MLCIFLTFVPFKAIGIVGVLITSGVILAQITETAWGLIIGIGATVVLLEFFSFSFYVNWLAWRFMDDECCRQIFFINANVSKAARSETPNVTVTRNEIGQQHRRKQLEMYRTVEHF